jgi:Fe-coproporphyrin III synthase
LLMPDGKTILPFAIVIEPTMRCNLRCFMCPFYGENGTPPDIKNELSTEKFIKIIDKISQAYRNYPYKPLIGLTGGEPFVRQDIFKILKYIKKKGLKYSITTNFSLLDESKIKLLSESPPSDLRISIDGPEEIHDMIRGVKGTFKRTTDAISTIRKNKRTKNLKIVLKCVMSQKNIDHIHEMVPIAKKLGTDLSFQHLYFLDNEHDIENKKVTKKYFGKEIENPVVNLIVPPTKEEVSKLISQIKRAKKLAKKLDVNIDFLPPMKEKDIPRYYSDLKNYTNSKVCGTPWSTIRINPKGDVYPCFLYNYGNLLEEDLKKIINNKKARKFRKALKKEKLFPSCIRCCKI